MTDRAVRPIPGVKLPAALQVGANSRKDWVRWKEEWDDYVTIQAVESKPREIQLALFLTALGAEARKLLCNQPALMKEDGTGQVNMEEAQMKTLVTMMQTALTGEVNDSYEYHVFQTRNQKEETIDEFITALRELISRCEVCNCPEKMTDKLLKYQTIFGIRDTTVREKLLQVQERKLTLETCIDMCRAAASANKQAKDVDYHGGKSEVNRVTGEVGYPARPGAAGRGPRGRQSRDEQYTAEQQQADGGQERWRQCRFCGRYHAMSPASCPTFGRRCNKCGGRNHFASKCSAPSSGDANDGLQSSDQQVTMIGAMEGPENNNCYSVSGIH